MMSASRGIDYKKTARVFFVKEVAGRVGQNIVKYDVF